jgi:hypothetical protein
MSPPEDVTEHPGTAYLEGIGGPADLLPSNQYMQGSELGFCSSQNPQLQPFWQVPDLNHQDGTSRLLHGRQGGPKPSITENCCESIAAQGARPRQQPKPNWTWSLTRPWRTDLDFRELVGYVWEPIWISEKAVATTVVIV